MRGRAYLNAVLSCIVIGGIVAVIGTVDTGSVTSSPAAGGSENTVSAVGAPDYGIDTYTACHIIGYSKNIGGTCHQSRLD